MRKRLFLKSCLMIFGICLFTNVHASEPIAYKIGAILPLTGNGSIYGEWIKKGCDLAVEQINMGGGINGRQLLITYEDDQTNPKTAVSVFQKMVNIEKVNFIITGSSASTLALKPLAAENKIVLFAPAATHPDLTQGSNHVFRNVISSYQETLIMSHYLIDDNHIKDIVVIYINDAGGQGSLEAFNQNFQKLGGIITGTFPFNKGEKDFRNMIAKVKANRPKAIYLTGYGPEMGLVLTQLRQGQVTAPVFSNQGIESPDLLKQAGNAANGVRYTLAAFDISSSNEDIKRFAEAYKSKYREDPGLYQATAFDSVMIYASVISNIKGDYSSLIDSIIKIRSYSGASGITSFTQNGDAIKPVAIKEIQNGRFVTLTKKTPTY